jgi:hypothetical protein
MTSLRRAIEERWGSRKPAAAKPASSILSRIRNFGSSGN